MYKDTLQKVKRFMTETGIMEIVYTGSISGSTWNKIACPAS